jgi:hypothetical protein
MRPRTAILAKTPFAIDPKPMDGALTPLAGLCAFSRAYRSLGLPAVANANIRIKLRERGFTPAQSLESLVLLHIAGGDHMRDIELLRGNEAIDKMLGYTPPTERCVADFLEAFHDHDLLLEARQRAERRGQLSILPDPSPALIGLEAVLRHAIGAHVARMSEQPAVATVDLDATIIESAKREAMRTYEGTKGYQPVVAMWAETGLILADEFRDGNVPAGFSPLSCAKAAFAALPETVTARFFRGDSACHEHELLSWLRDPNRASGPREEILFAVSARLSKELAQHLARVHDSRWTTYAVENNGTLRQWADLSFVPGEHTERQHITPLRYIGLRLLKPQGELFADGNDRHFHAIITNRSDPDGGALLTWHRQKAGTIEHVHDEVKNGLGGGCLPSAKFGANAAWFRIACIAYNILHAVRSAWPEETMHTAKAKRIRFVIVNVTGRFSRDSRKISLHLSATVKWIQHLQTVFDKFPLRTQATG